MKIEDEEDIYEENGNIKDAGGKQMTGGCWAGRRSMQFTS